MLQQTHRTHHNPPQPTTPHHTQAEVIVWDLKIAFAGDNDGTDGEVGARAKIHKLLMHRVKVREIA